MPESDFESHFDLGCMAYISYRYEQAATEFAKCVELNPDHPQARFRLALALTRFNQLGPAWQHFQASLPRIVLEALPDKAKQQLFGLKVISELCKSAEAAGVPADDVTYCRGLVHLANHIAIPFDKDESSLAMKELLKLQNSSKAFLFRGLAMAANNDVISAIDQLSKAIELDPNFGLAYQHRAIHQAATKHHREAIEDATKAMQLGFSTETLAILRVEQYLTIGKFEECVADATMAIPSVRDRRRAYFIRGAANFHLEKLDEAAADFDEAIKLTTADRSGTNSGDSIWSRSEAISTFETRLANNPGDHLALCNRGMAYYLKGCPGRVEDDWNKAERDLSAAIDLDPANPRYYLSRAILKSLFKHAESREDCNKAIELKPDLVEAYLVRANLSGDAELKKQEFAEALTVAPTNPDLLRAHSFYHSTRGTAQSKLEAVDMQIARSEVAVPVHLWNERGQLKLKANDAAGAMEDFVRALKINPELADALRGRRQAYLMQGDWDTAKLDEAELVRLDAPLAASSL